MKFMIKKLSFLILLFIGIFTLMSASPTKADSGWDTDYDSGGSYSSSDDYYSSSSNDYYYSGGSSSNGGATRMEVILMEVFVSPFFIYAIGRLFGREGSNSLIYIITAMIRTVFLIFLNTSYSPAVGGFDLTLVIIFSSVVISLPKKRKANISYTPTSYVDIPESDLLNYGIGSLSDLKNELYNKFVDIQNAWMNFDYDKLRSLCTDELYNSYESQLMVLKRKNGQNIMSDFNLIDIKIFSVSNVNNRIVVRTYMRVSFYDYVINTTNNKVTRGLKNAKVFNNYEMTFIKSGVDNSLFVKCPSCNAEVAVNASGKCEYCGNVIVKDAGEFVLSVKRIVGR